MGEDIKSELGLSRMSAIVADGKQILELRFYNGKPDQPIKVVYDKDLEKTAEDVKQVFVDSHLFDNKIEQLTKFLKLLTQSINDLKRDLVTKKKRSRQEEEEKKRAAYEKARAEEVSQIKERIKRMRDANIGISTELWRDGLTYRYNELKKIIDENIPEVWPGLEFELSSSRILNIEGCTLPFIGILLARPSSCKTVDLNLFKPWPCTYYTDNFSPKSFLTHTTSVKTEEELSKIDMLPRIKNRHLLTPELAPIFTTDEKDLAATLGIITRVADGHGLATDSGVHGHREYRDTMFVWTGAAVDVPYKAYKMLAGLGFKIYFFRLPYKEKSVFSNKMANIQSALFDYLGWFEIGPDLIHDKESDLYRMRWDYEKNEIQARRWIIRLAQVLAHLRCIAQTWTIEEDSQGSNYGYHHTQPESPERAIEHLTNLARGHALLTGRNFITIEDVPIVVKTVLSTAIIDRVGLFRLLIANDGVLGTEDVEKFLNVTKSTASRNMLELRIIGLVDQEEEVVLGTGAHPPYVRKSIRLKEKFDCLLDQEFQKLCDGFEPVDNREFMDSKDVKNRAKTKAEPSRGNSTPYSLQQVAMFLRVFGELEQMETDKVVSHDKLQETLTSNGMSQSDAAIMIKDMTKEGLIEEVLGSYRRKKV
jgi:predicted transcriptional regulator